MNKQSRRNAKVFGEFGDVFHGEVALAIEEIVVVARSLGLKR